MTMRVSEVLVEILLGVVTRNLTLSEELLELPAVERLAIRTVAESTAATRAVCSSMPSVCQGLVMIGAA